MKLSNFSFITLLFLSINTLHAMQEENIEYRTYQGTPIDSETIGSLVQPLPEAYDSVVKEWRDNNQPLLQELCDFSCKNSEWRQHFEKCSNLLKEAGLENKSKWSYIFSLPKNSDLFVQLSGPLFRMWNLEGIDFYQVKDHDAIAKAKTYQTISRFAYYLKYLENNLHNVTIPATYLVPLNDKQPNNDYSDDNCFVVQERVPQGCVALHENKDRLQDVSHLSLQEFLTLINTIGLWDTGANTLIDENNNLVISDIEQPGNEEPRYFFHKNRWLYENQIKTGLSGLYGLCESHSELQRIIQDFARNKVHFKHSDKQKELEQELKLNE